MFLAGSCGPAAPERVTAAWIARSALNGRASSKVETLKQWRRADSSGLEPCGGERRGEGRRVVLSMGWGDGGCHAV